jgi:hypothetical protein
MRSVLAYALLVLCLICLAFWARSSLRIGDNLYVKYRTDTFIFTSDNCQLCNFHHTEPTPDQPLAFVYNLSPSGFSSGHLPTKLGFSWRQFEIPYDDPVPFMQQIHELVLPWWFISVVAGLAACIVRPSPRFRFSLREMFAIATIFGVILAIAVAFKPLRNAGRISSVFG